MRPLRVLLLALVALAAAPGPAAAMPAPDRGRETTAHLLARLGGERCPESEFTCVTLTVPLDHFDATNKRTIDVVFAVLPATGRRKGMFVTATGGPGSSGIAAADSYTSFFDPRIPRRFDVVFFDQRGIAASGGLTCPDAAAAFYRADLRADTLAGETAVKAAARTFAAACVTEMGSPATLPYLGTAQAVEDLEAFRQLVDDERLWLYGESYGTQYAQTYAAAHPEHLRGLVLDGTVDLTLSGVDFFAEEAKAFEDVLALTLRDCDRKRSCRADAGGDALAAYDRLAARLERAPVPLRFPLPSGGTARRELTLSDLQTVAASEIYGEGGRMMLQRAVAAASRGDLRPLARLLYLDLGLDPETLAAIPDPTYSDGMYYGVECQDYRYFAGTPDERAEQYLRAGDTVDPALPRLGAIFYGDLPCTFWPDATQDPERPAPLRAEGVTTLVLGATADPATPVGNGVSVYRRLADGYLVTQQGGPHVIFGRGRACPDELVTAFLVDGTRPAKRESTCPGVVADGYVPLAPAAAASFRTPRAALASAETEITYLPEYSYWDGETPTSVGCPFGGGTMRFRAQGALARLVLSRCAFSRGFVMTGTGSYDYESDRFVLDVRATGRIHGRFRYVREGGRTTVTPRGAGSGSVG